MIIGDNLYIIILFLALYYFVFTPLVKIFIINKIQIKSFKYLFFFFLLTFPFLDHLTGFVLFNIIPSKNEYKQVLDTKKAKNYWFVQNISGSKLDKDTYFYRNLDRQVERFSLPFSQKMVFNPNEYTKELVGYLNYCKDTSSNENDSCKYTQNIIESYNLKNVLKVPKKEYLYKKETKDFPLIGFSYKVQKMIQIDTAKVLGINSEVEFEGGYILNKLFPKSYQEKKGKLLSRKKFEESVIPNAYAPYERNQFLIIKSPILALDINGNGIIDTLRTYKSKVFFNLNGFDMKNKTAWLKKEDALLVYDKDNNGKIESLDELFGNVGLSGFDELKSYDKNGDGNIDKDDDIFVKLQLWFDKNNNGKTESGELKSLEKAGIKALHVKRKKVSVELSDTKINEVSWYKENDDTKYLLANVFFYFDTGISSLDLKKDGKYFISYRTLKLPRLRGYGFIPDAFLSYNRNKDLEKLALKFYYHHELIQSSFDLFINEWSGYSAYKRKALARYGIKKDVDMADLDRKIWILERFVGKKSFSPKLEKNYEKQLKKYQPQREIFSIGHKSKYVLNKAYINKHFKKLKSRTESDFALQTIYPSIIKHISFNTNTDEFTFINKKLFYERVKEYLNNPSNKLQDKVYLFYLIQVQSTKSKRVFNMRKILKSVESESLYRILSKKIKPKWMEII
jgi:hypothetical protein